MTNHIKTQEGDEMVCSCGLRWDVGEADPHPPVMSFSQRMHRARREKQMDHKYRRRRQ